MTKEEIYADIVAGVLAAVDCAKRGEPHPRLNSIKTRTAAHFASFNPPCPIHLLPHSRRPFSDDNPAPDIKPADIGSWYDGMKGRYGQQRND
jgi:hypothetical protein